MQNDPLVEWQRLSQTYSKMYDEELLELATSKDDLTEQARQALGDEMRKRGLELRSSSAAAFRPVDTMRARAAAAISGDADAPEDGEVGEPQREYTWKTALRGCDSQEEAWQIYEVLRRAGIESWIVRPGASQAVVWDERMVGNIQVQVAADQLDEARTILANPIPPEIVELSAMQVPEFELPVCPKCGAGDPILEGVDPVNTWLCESCDHTWTENAED